MKNYIEREAVIKGFTDLLQKPGDIYPTDITTMMQNIPTADVKPVVRGEWKKMPDDACICSICGLGLETWTQAIFYNFCPFCGADMRGEN